MAEKSSFRFTIAMRLFSELYIKPPVIVGLRNLTEIPKDKPLVIASTHLSDIDVQTIAANIARYRNVGIASQASNQRHPVIGTFLRIAGIENVFGITNEYDTKKRISRYTFNPDDFDKMKSAIENGKTIIIAAHKPTYNWKLPEKAGKGAEYLAQLARATILPVALDIKSSVPIGMADRKIDTIKRFITRKRPNSRLIIGKPINLDPAPSLAKLHQQGQLVLKALADLLPQEKRWI